MPIDLNPSLKARLVEQLSGQLRSATVVYNAFVSIYSLQGLTEIKSLPDKGKIADSLQLCIGDDPFATFVAAEINSIFKGPGFEEGAQERLLVSYEGYEDASELATQLVDRFCSLPWTYHVTIRLPAAFQRVAKGRFDGLELSPRHRIVFGSKLRHDHPQTSPKRPGLANVLAGTSAWGWEDEEAYLQMDIEGFFNGVQSESFNAALDELRAFFGLGVALGLFVPSRYDVLGEKLSVTPLHVHRFVDGAWVEGVSLGLNESLQVGINRLTIDDGAIGGVEALLERIERVAVVLRSNDGKNLMLSSRWLLDSYFGHDELLNYVQAAVAIEILLGDEDVDHSVGLTTLMANRCAYLIARTPAARSNLLRYFRDIYKVRSKIVHRGKNRLNKGEVSLFHMLQSIARAVIDKEQVLLARSVAAS